MKKKLSAYNFHVDNYYGVLTINYLLLDQESYQYYDTGLAGLFNPLFEDDAQPAILQHLFEKDWVSLDLLYDLAEEIQKFYPDNPFDWQKTFRDLEFVNHVNEIDFPESEDFEDNDAGQVMDGVERRIAYMAIAVEDQALDRTIRENVLSKLKKHGLA